MTIYNLYLFGREGKCIYYRDWNRRTQPSNLQEEFKLIYGLIWSLKSFNEKTSPDPRSDGTFNFFRTNAYAFHYYETPTGLKFCITTDPLVSDRREMLKTIYSLYVRFVVMNPLYVLNSPVTEELFIQHLEKYVRSQQCFAPPTSSTSSSSHRR